MAYFIHPREGQNQSSFACRRGFRDLSALALDDEDSDAWMVDRALRL